MKQLFIFLFVAFFATVQAQGTFTDYVYQDSIESITVDTVALVTAITWSPRELYDNQQITDSTSVRISQMYSPTWVFSHADVNEQADFVNGIEQIIQSLQNRISKSTNDQQKVLSKIVSDLSKIAIEKEKVKDKGKGK